MSKYEIRKATVITTNIIDDDETRRQMQYFVSNIELHTESGTIQRTIQTPQPLTEGSKVDVKYDPEKRKFKLIKKTKDSELKGAFRVFFVVAILFGFFGISYCALTLNGYNKELAMQVYKYFVIILSVIWAMYIVWLIATKGKIFEQCTLVKGNLVGYIKQGYEPTDESNPRLRQAPIYEYSYGSLMHRYKSSRMRTGAEKSTLIAVNNITGEVFGVEDKKNDERMKIFLMCFTYFCFAFIAFLVFIMARKP